MPQNLDTNLIFSTNDNERITNSSNDDLIPHLPQENNPSQIEQNIQVQEKIYDVVILGAGPAGLFSAYELKKQNPNLHVLLLEQGNDIDKRSSRETLSGMGGAGTFSDGKLHFTPVLSHEKLLDLFTVDYYQMIIDYIDNLFSFFGVDAPYTPQNHDEAMQLVKYCQRKGVNMYLRKCKHVGSDVLPSIIKNMEEFLLKHGLEIRCQTKIVEIISSDHHAIMGLRTEKGETIRGKYFLVAPGRVGASWLQKEAQRIGLKYDYQKVEIGVRVEFPSGVMEKHSEIMHENIYAIQTPTYDDIIRTFCPCPNGKVAIEDYGDYVSVNGYSNAKSKSENSNFDFTTVVQLTEPVENTTEYAISIAKLTTTIGGGKPLIQRLADLRSGRRSTPKRIEKSYVNPTLKDATPGDISMAFPHRLVTNILEGLEILDQVLPGINSGATLLYAPEVKLRGNRIKINKKMQTEIPNLFVAGDGAGASGNIIGAGVSGILAAYGILETMKKD